MQDQLWVSAESPQSQQPLTTSFRTTTDMDCRSTSRVSEALPSYEKSLSMPTALAAVGATPPGSPGLRPSFDSQATVTESFQAPHTARQHPKIDEE